ncbi:hypothetical protein [Vagococcus fessus]|uniref:Uncharacterized protein n=1 Tax=Vagococcus fessus TaxID=120370 RepID=A0A430A807_9ENTE|nr:hypothetical protein [Vagococcus fessus]RSU03250.1 hypothetical protein CBF31_05915 [Vagococcus fessus]
MNTLESVKAELYFNVAGELKQQREMMTDLQLTATPEQLDQLGKLLETITPKVSTYDSTVLVTRTRYYAM